jgi:protease I
MGRFAQMTNRSLGGKRVAVFVEHKFIAEEIETYRTAFRECGAELHFASRLWYGDNRPAQTAFFSDLDPLDDKATDLPKALIVDHDVSQIAAHLDTYCAIVMAANYTSVRLRFANLPNDDFAKLTSEQIATFDPQTHVRSAPVVELFAAAMQRPRLVKGALCHGLWVLTPNPRLLAGRQVICHTVVMADVLNCGAHIVLTPTGVVADGDLVTGFSKHQTRAFVDAIAAQVAAVECRA